MRRAQPNVLETKSNGGLHGAQSNPPYKKEKR
ncbi:MAG: hypothetical protein KPEEDBHJ_01659 [Anaerolineales bacterium]|nr:hypothetical protein [Anaerolineales bacterium]